MFLAVYADAKGRVYEHPQAAMLGRSGNGWVEPLPEELIPLPEGASLVAIPGFSPVGMQKNGKPFVMDQDLYGCPGRAQAIAALLPQGFTRTLLPACVGEAGRIMPLMGYAAVGFYNGQFYVAAVQSDEHRKWHPKYYNLDDLPEQVETMLNRFPDNRIVQQIGHCSLEYNCFTAQNIFYGRWEGGIPTFNKCNANCIGCISESHMPTDSPQNRLCALPDADEVTELGAFHLQHAEEGIISFGQGCEGDPSLNAVRLAPAIRAIREITPKGTININTNAGYTKGLVQMIDAGLDAMRVTMFSAREDSYNYYHRPKYTLQNVLDTIDYAKKNGVRVSVNALIFPGFSDRESELSAWLDFVEAHHIDLFQLRNLNMDPDLLLKGLPQEEGLGMLTLLETLKENSVGMELGSYTHPVR